MEHWNFRTLRVTEAGSLGVTGAGLPLSDRLWREINC